MPKLWELLDPLSPIIYTARTGDLAERPEQVRNAYELYSASFHPLESAKRVWNSLQGRVQGSQWAMGYVSGDYGYGKTAVATWLWEKCESEQFVGVPPFLFYGFDDLLAATSAWLQFRILESHPDLAKQARSLYERFRSRSFEERARKIAEQDGVPFAKAQQIVKREIEPFQDMTSPAHVVDFLSEAGSLACKAGYRGLVIFADELQDFLNQPPGFHARVEEIRRFVHAFTTLAQPVGVFFTVTADVEGALSEQAGDAIQRMQQHGAFLPLEDAYGVDFPRDLWEHLCRKVDSEERKAVDDATLEALGQIISRKDLSNGPRTAVAAFRCIARHWQQNREPYKVWNLLDDYEQGKIVFEGKQQQISLTIRQLLDDPLVRDHPRFRQPVRFLCAFPSGVRKETADKYEVWDPIDELANAWGFLGTHIVQPASDHFALKQLQRIEGPGDKLTTLLQLFRNKWWHSGGSEEHLRCAQGAFITHVIPDLMPRRGSGEHDKWSGHASWQQAETLCNAAVASVGLEGSFEGTQMRFPGRRLEVAASTDGNRLVRWKPSRDDTELCLCFHLDEMDEDVAGRVITTPGEARIDFHLNLKRHVGSNYPSDLALFRDILSPHHCSAELLLNLVFYLQALLDRPDIPEQDRQQIRSNLLRPAVRHAIGLLLPEDMQSVGVEVKGARQALLESCFEQKCADLYPDYRPLAAVPQSRYDVERYRRVLKEGGLGLKQKRGIEPMQMTREELAQTLGLSGTSQLDAVVARLKSLELLKTREEETGNGRKIVVEFGEHRLERQIRDLVRERGQVAVVRRGGRDREVKQFPSPDVARYASRLGYLGEELETVLEFAALRGWLEVDDGYVREAVPDLDPDLLRQEADELRSDLQLLRPYFEDVLRFEQNIDDAVARTYQDDPIQLDEARLGLSAVRAGLQEFVRLKADQLANETMQVQSNLQTLQKSLPTQELSQALNFPGLLSEKLEDIRAKLDASVTRLKAQFQQTAAEAAQLARNVASANSSSRLAEEQGALAELAKKVTKLNEAVESELTKCANWRQWKALAADAAQLRSRCPERFAELRGELDDWTNLVARTFREGWNQALTRHEHFKPTLDELNHRLSQSLGEEESRFRTLVVDYESIMSQNQISVQLYARQYSASDPEGSYDALTSEVLQRLRETADEFGGSLHELGVSTAFLQSVRQKDVTELQARVKTLHDELRRLESALTSDTVRSYPDGDQAFVDLCQSMGRWLSLRSGLMSDLNKADTAQPLDPGAESDILDTVRGFASNAGARSDVSVSQLWQEFTQNKRMCPEALFTLLEQLYRKGWLEITVCERKR